MALIRNVLFPDGTILGYHEVDNILHIAHGGTHLEITSYPSADDLTAAHHVQIIMDLDDTLTFDRAYEVLAADERFQEYTSPEQAALDEVLPILTDEQAATVPDAFREWKPETEYKAGDRRKYNGALYKCLQDHTSQADWSPDVAVSLWARILIPDPEVIPVWEQPDSTNPYMIGDKVHFPTIDDPVYESTIDGNVWSPEAYPQGWRLVTGDEE